MNNINENIAVLHQEMEWFSAILEYRFSSHFRHDMAIEKPELPSLSEGGSSYGDFVLSFGLSESHRIILMLAMIPHFLPQMFDIFFTKNANTDRPFTEFGGRFDHQSSGFLPTVETAHFLIAEEAVSQRTIIRELLSASSPLISEDVVRIGDLDEGHHPSFFSRSLSLNEIFLSYFTYGVKSSPDSMDIFPARQITTEMEWDDLVLEETIRSEVEQICQWVRGENMLRDLSAVRKYVKPGFRCLFYGPPGTGKSLTATLIGKETDREVYRIDLSMIVSKYIGETEKNLSRVFDYAEKRNWILFFDEADALFGKRTQANSSNDRFANQEVAYLLQRIEDFPGIVILASNLKSNIDEAFSRRFQSMIYFPMPDSNQRLRLWKNMFATEVALEEGCDLQEIAENYELSGGSAINVFRFGLMKAMARSSLMVSTDDLIEGIRKEYLKYGRTL